MYGNQILVPLSEDVDPPEAHTDDERQFNDEKRRLLKLAQCARGMKKIEAVHEYMALLDSPERLPDLLPLIENEPAKAFWLVFMEWWAVCDGTWPWNARLVEILHRVGPCDQYLHEWDKGAFFDSLPDHLTVYRGANRRRIRGALSWTTDLETAYRFALGRGVVVHDPVIATGVIDKAAIFFATNTCSEKEILALPRIIHVKPLARRHHAYKQACFEQTRVARNWSKIVAAHEYMSLLDYHHDRIASLLSLIEFEPAEVFWPIFIRWWPCKGTWKSMRRLTEVLRRVGPCDPYYFGDDQGGFYDSLPDRLTIFRGTCRSRVKNAICWTDDIEIARDFVLSRRSYRSPVMATAEINKNEIFMVNRDMREILALPRIINVEPL